MFVKDNFLRPSDKRTKYIFLLLEEYIIIDSLNTPLKTVRTRRTVVCSVKYNIIFETAERFCKKDHLV